MTSNTDFRVLGRLGTATGPLSGGTLKRTWSPRRGSRVQRRKDGVGVDARALLPRPLMAAVLALVLALFYVGSTVGGQVSAPLDAAAAAADVDPLLEASLLSGADTMVDTGARTLVPGGGAHATLRALPDAFAAMGDVALRLPAEDVEGILFTESRIPDALPLVPVGTMASNANPGYEPTLDAQGPEYRVLAPPTGVRPATSRAEVLVAPGSAILAPVTGEIVEVSQYEVEAGISDWQVKIAPDQRPDLMVVLRHVDVATVVAGQRVDAGETTVGTVRSMSPVVSDDNPLALPSIALILRPALAEPLPTIGSEAGVDPFAPAVSPTATATS